MEFRNVSDLMIIMTVVMAVMMVVLMVVVMMPWETPKLLKSPLYKITE